MTTASDLIEETRRHLFSGQESESNRLNGALTDTATSVPLKYALGSVTKGCVLAVGLEEMRVWEVTASTASVVERGINGTTAAAHADLSLVTVRPKFSDFRILSAINNDLADLSSPVNGLFAVDELDITYNPAGSGYDLVADFINVIEVRYVQTGPTKNMPPITSFAVTRDVDTSIYPSGNAIFFYQSAYPGLPIRVRYSKEFTRLSTLADDVQTVSGLPASANDLPPLGAAIRLVPPRDIKRAFSEAQYDPRRAEEVPPNSASQSVSALRALRQQRIIAESARLLSDWPMMRAG